MSQSFKDIFKSSYVMDKQTIFFFVIPTWMLIDSKEKFSINGYLSVLNNISQPSSMYSVLANLFTNLQIQKEITRYMYMYNKHSIQNLGISM